MDSSLIILTTIPFIVQLQRLYSTKTDNSLSPSYVICNLILATEQLTIIFYMMVSVPEAAGGVFTHDPQNAGDWLNFTQITITWILFLALYVLAHPHHSGTQIW